MSHGASSYGQQSSKLYAGDTCLQNVTNHRVPPIENGGTFASGYLKANDGGQNGDGSCIRSYSDKISSLVDGFNIQAKRLMDPKKNFVADSSFISKYINGYKDEHLNKDMTVDSILKKYSMTTKPVVKDTDHCSSTFFPSCPKPAWGESIGAKDFERYKRDNQNMNESFTVSSSKPFQRSPYAESVLSSSAVSKSKKQPIKACKSSSGFTKENSNCSKVRSGAAGASHASKCVPDTTNNCQCSMGKVSKKCPVHCRSGCPQPGPRDDKCPCQFGNSEGTKGEKKKAGANNKPPQTRYQQVKMAKKVYKENEELRTEGMKLGNSIACVRQGLMRECAQVLLSLLNICEERSRKQKKEVKSGHNTSECCALKALGLPSPVQSNAGCSGNMCGGYTPSGWNKAKAKGSDSSECLESRPKPCAARDEPKDDCSSPGFDATTSGVVDSNMCPSVRILGELAFQLERRILEYVFGVEGKMKHRFYGYTVSNVCYMITKECSCPSGKLDVIGKSDKANRFQKMMCALQNCGYDVKVHPEFSQDVVNKFGVLACKPDQCTVGLYRLQDAAGIEALICKLSTSPSEVANLNILLKSLSYLSKCDGKPLFVW